MAARPKTLTAALIPVMAGTALAENFHWHITLFAFLAAIFIQIGTNLINDALDFKKGADTSERLGPQRVTQSGLLSAQQVLAAGTLSFLAAWFFGMPLMIQGGWPIVFLLAISILCGYLYTGGPMPLAYHGLGELFVLMFFGLLGTVAVYYLQTGSVNIESIVAGTQIGLLATLLIAINNFRDYRGDAKANKRTLAVRFGKSFARYEIATLALLPFFLNLIWFGMGLHAAAILPWITFPLAILIVCKVWTTEPGRIYNQYLGFSALLHLVFGVLLSIGFVMR